MFRKYRILEVNGKFIPQLKVSIFDKWMSIKEYDETNYIWYSLKIQICYCSKPTIEEARLVITKYINKNKQQIHKY